MRQDLHATMSFGDHLDELRGRLILALLIPIPLFAVCMIFGGPLLKLVLLPLTNALEQADQPPVLLATNPIEPFAAYMKVSAVVALMGSMPWILYQLWRFVAPGLYQHERRFVYFFIPMSALLTIAGAAFLYFALLPISLYFLIQFGVHLVEQAPGVARVATDIVLPTAPILKGDPIDPAPASWWVNTTLSQLRIATPDGILGAQLQSGGVIAQQYRVGEYINLVFALAIAFIIAFQLPIVMLLIGWLGIVTPASLTKYRRHIGFGCAIAGAVLTPQDPFSMILLGGALYLLFELGIFMMRFITPQVIMGKTAPTTDANEEPEEGS